MKEDKKLILRNIELSAEFSRYLFEHPEFDAKIPSEAEVVLLPEFDDLLRSHNELLGREMETKGERVVYIRVGRMLPRTLSRLEEVVMTT